jgi:hypothetical protein
MVVVEGQEGSNPGVHWPARSHELTGSTLHLEVIIRAGTHYAASVALTRVSLFTAGSYTRAAPGIHMRHQTLLGAGIQKAWALRASCSIEDIQ